MIVELDGISTMLGAMHVSLRLHRVRVIDDAGLLVVHFHAVHSLEILVRDAPAAVRVVTAVDWSFLCFADLFVLFRLIVSSCQGRGAISLCCVCMRLYLYS